MANKRIDEATGVETVGHSWDGIEELNNPLPRWWLWTLYATIIFSIGYVIVYPAIPLASKPDLMRAAIDGGRAAFRVNCVQCHGSGAAGSTGYPNLRDDDWLWGGNIKEIETTLINGIRHPGNDATRQSLMPSFGKDGILPPADLAAVTDHVLSLTGKSTANARGAQLFADNCATCHGPDGKGLRQFGAPNLADAIWLYGGKREQVEASIYKARAGVMPAWTKTLDPVTIKMLAAYVHSLGGGEDFVAARAATPAAAAAATPATGEANAQP
jgi:cytochrome c oxidase cbb3-type subunit 3